MTTSSSEDLLSYQRRQKFWRLFESRYIIHLVLVVGVLSFLLPVIWTLLTSLKTNEAVYQLNYLPVNPTLQTYYQVLVGDGFWKAIRNSFLIATSTTVIVVVLSVPAGYAFSRYRFRFDNALFILVLFSRLFPPIGLIVPYFKIMSELSLLNSIPAIVMAAVYLWLPLMIYIMRNFFMSIPEELEESARIDGCTKFQAFRLVALPLAKPGIAAITILTYLFSWNEFLFALVISSNLEAMPVAVAVFDFVGDVSVQWASLAAAGILAILVPFIIVLLFQQYIVKGLTSGALKG